MRSERSCSKIDGKRSSSRKSLGADCFLAVELDSPARPLAMVKMNAATSEKMTKTRNSNPFYQFELRCYSRVQKRHAGKALTTYFKL